MSENLLIGVVGFIASATAGIVGCIASIISGLVVLVAVAAVVSSTTGDD